MESVCPWQSGSLMCFCRVEHDGKNGSMNFGVNGLGLGIKVTRKHIEGCLINPETSMEDISSKNGVKKPDADKVSKVYPQAKPSLPAPESDLEEFGEFEALLGKSLIKY